MNISSSSGYASIGNLQNYPGNNGTDPNDTDRSKAEHDHDDPQVQAEKAREQKLKDQKLKDQKQHDQLAEEQKLQKKEEYKKEDKEKEVRQKDMNTLFEKQQQQQQDNSKVAHDILIESIYNQIGAGSQLVITKDNYEDAIKDLVNRGFQISADEERITISSKMHQLKLEISKDSYQQFVKAQQERWVEAGNHVESTTAPNSQAAETVRGNMSAGSAPTPASANTDNKGNTTASSATSTGHHATGNGASGTGGN